MNWNREIILASQSPRRAELLREHGYRFRIIPPDPNAECGICSRETPPELVARLAWQKAENVAGKVAEGLIIACDTVAECAGRILGKPRNREHAKEMLSFLRGSDHAVYSGLCLLSLPSRKSRIRVDVSRLFMKPISDAELEDYLDSELWQGKAGAFGYQDDLDWIELKTGSASNVVGLPMELLRDMLADFDSEPESGCTSNSNQSV